MPITIRSPREIFRSIRDRCNKRRGRGRLMSQKLVENPLYRVFRALLDFSKEAVDGVGVPGLKVALSGISTILKTIEQTDENYESLKKLEEVLSDTLAVLPAFDQVTLPEPQMSHIQSLTMKIGDISDQILSKQEASAFRRTSGKIF
ncbi:hypothetical protein PLICRDRAFT_174229 [Plicaturopsis crispa FD-325 SS-3]|nr:hypothetical protein PLICRDRAFT_174229 [Plicaturopsis crispa FD-325 SS-3]